MLDLLSETWTKLDTYFGDGSDIPQNLRFWRASFGTPAEEQGWNTLRDQFLHQHTITPAAIAIVPHICRLLSGTSKTIRHYCVIDLGQVHMAWRRQPFQLPFPHLAKAYELAILSIRSVACECLTRPLDPIDFRYLLSACSALCDHVALGHFLFTIDSLDCDHPDLTSYM